MSFQYRTMQCPTSKTLTYLVWDSESKEALLIDPVLENVERDTKAVNELGLTLKYTLETHVHADHITGGSKLKETLGSQTVIGKATGVSCADIVLDDRQKLPFAGKEIEAIATPGHTNGCTTFLFNGWMFTGDTLLIRGCGRTDFQEGSPETLFFSVRGKLFTYSDDTKVLPGHDYKGLFESTIGEEKKYNPRLGLDKSEADFVEIMNNLNLADPAKIKEAVPANMNCGKT